VIDAEGEERLNVSLVLDGRTLDERQQDSESLIVCEVRYMIERVLSVYVYVVCVFAVPFRGSACP